MKKNTKIGLKIEVKFGILSVAQLIDLDEA